MPIKVYDGTSWVQVSDGVDGADGASSSTIPSGTIVMYNSSTAPTGWVLCDNSAAAQSAGAPDLRDKFIVGASPTGGNATYPGLTVGEGGGHTDTPVVSHTHGLTHTHGGGTYAAQTNGNHNHNESGGQGYQSETSEAGWARSTGDHGNFNHATDGDHTHSITGSSGAASTSLSLIHI